MGTGPINDPPPSGPGRLWDQYDLAAFLGLSAKAVSHMVTRRRCPRITWIGGKARFDPADVTAWVDAQKEKPPTVAPAVPLAAVPARGRRRVA